jgi:hypothetical protein
MRFSRATTAKFGSLLFDGALAPPALVIVTSFSRPSSLLRMAVRRASSNGRRLRVRVVWSSDVSPLRSPYRLGPRDDVEQGIHVMRRPTWPNFSS